VYVATVFADDEDFGGNAKIVYTFEDFSQTKGPFNVDRTTGNVTMISSLDRETQEEYAVGPLASNGNACVEQVCVGGSTCYY